MTVGRTRKPAVIDPSHMPRTNRTTKRLVKLVHAAWQQSTTPHVNMLRLSSNQQPGRRVPEKILPHPLPDGETLKGQILRIFK